VIELIIASGISGVISSASLLIALRMRLKHLSERDEREKKRYESAMGQCSDAFYRGGLDALRTMRDVQVALLRATAPEPRRGLIEQLTLAIMGSCCLRRCSGRCTSGSTHAQQ
jgi:hypothetical protein